MSNLESQYAERRCNVLVPLAKSLQEHLEDHFKSFPRIDRITTRAKSVDRFVAKANKKTNGETKYSSPLDQIQDQIGARIVTFYLTDVEQVAAEIMRYFKQIESKSIVPEKEREFGYFGRHFILFLPSDILVLSP